MGQHRCSAVAGTYLWQLDIWNNPIKIFFEGKESKNIWCFSDAGTNSTALSSGANSPDLKRHVIPRLEHVKHVHVLDPRAPRHPETVSSPQYQVPRYYCRAANGSSRNWLAKILKAARRLWYLRTQGEEPIMGLLWALRNFAKSLW